MKYLLSLFIFLFCFGCAKAPLKVTSVGDSITNGYGSSTHGQELPGYQGILKDKLEEFFGDVKMLNFATSDTSSGEGLEMIEKLGSQESGGYLLILYGTIDLHRGLPKKGVVGNLRNILGAARGRGFSPIIGTLPPDPAHDSDSEPNDVSILNELIREMAEEEDVVVADHHVAFRGNPDLLFDGAHPNDSGYRIMAEVWAQAIFDSLNST